MDRELRDKGLANRKKVLGAAYVEKSMASGDSFNAPFHTAETRQGPSRIVFTSPRAKKPMKQLAQGSV